jgi:hypothetical protein
MAFEIHEKTLGKRLHLSLVCIAHHACRIYDLAKARTVQVFTMVRNNNKNFCYEQQ